MIIALDASASATLTNSATETVLKSHVLEPKALSAGKAYRVRARVQAPGTNSTDTLRVRLRVGPTTLTGSVIADTGAVDVANADVAVVEALFAVRADGVIVADGEAAIGALGTATKRPSGGVVTGMNFALAQRIEVTGVWSVANAGNQAIADLLVVEEIGAI